MKRGQQAAGHLIHGHVVAFEYGGHPGLVTVLAGVGAVRMAAHQEEVHDTLRVAQTSQYEALNNKETLHNIIRHWI